MFPRTMMACLILAACATPSVGQTPPAGAATATAAAASREARARAIIEALSAGDAAAYETVAREHYSDALYARRTTAERADFVAQMAADFSPMRIEAITEEGDQLVVRARGSGPMTATLTFSFDTTPQQKIARIDIAAEAGDADGPGDGPRFPPPPVSTTQSAAEMSAAIDRWLAPALQHDDFAGVILIARDGKPFVTRIYGPAVRSPDGAGDRAPDAQTAYNIASIGKKFTQTAVARLIQEGRLSLTTTLGEVLPDYPNAEARSATIAQLVGMRGGISDFFGPGFEDQPKDRFSSNHAYYEYVSHLPQRFAPGTRNEYCNGCYVVLGEIVERLSGMRFEDYVQRHVLAPAGMTRSGYFNSASLPANTARGYTRSDGPGSPYVDAFGQHGRTGSGAGGVYSTALDLLAFDNALREGKLLNAEMAAWVMGGAPQEGRSHAALAVAGGAPGTNSVLESDGRWTVIITANVDPQVPERVGIALARQLSR